MEDRTQNIICEITGKWSIPDNRTIFEKHQINQTEFKAKCSICGKILSDNDTYNFFSEDSSCMCSDCLKKYLKKIENIRYHDVKEV